jgi:CheY-like chemotaxis protein
VDDDASARRAYHRAFSGKYEVVLADGAEQALSVLGQRTDFQVIVCDLVMPEVNGIQLFQAVQKLYPAQAEAFVFVTGLGIHAESQAFLESVRNQVLQKPFELSTIRQLLELRSAC